MKHRRAVGSTAKSSVNETVTASFALVPGDIDVADVDELIRTQAHLRAQQRGFIPGAELDDWFAAEQDVRATLESTPANSAVR